MQTDSFRILNWMDEYATVWPVGEHFFAVCWDESIGTQDVDIYKKELVESHLSNDTWKKIDV